MALTLRRPIDKAETTILVDGEDAASSGDRFTIDDEYVEVRTADPVALQPGESAWQLWSVRRGQLGSAEVAHDMGATLTAVPAGAGTGGGSFPPEWTVGEDGSLAINVTGALASPGTFENNGLGLGIDSDGAVAIYPNAGTGGGATVLLRVYTEDGAESVFEVRANGSVHIKSGTSIVADL